MRKYYKANKIDKILFRLKQNLGTGLSRIEMGKQLRVDVDRSQIRHPRHYLHPLKKVIKNIFLWPIAIIMWPMSPFIYAVKKFWEETIEFFTYNSCKVERYLDTINF